LVRGSALMRNSGSLNRSLSVGSFSSACSDTFTDGRVPASARRRNSGSLDDGIPYCFALDAVALDMPIAFALDTVSRDAVD
jgi:hypothetical protein